MATKAEWDATVARAVQLGCFQSGLQLTDDAGTGCLFPGSPGNPSGGTSFITDVLAVVDGPEAWSSATDETFPEDARVVDFNDINGNVSRSGKATEHLVWPVRGISF